MIAKLQDTVFSKIENVQAESKLDGYPFLTRIENGKWTGDSYWPFEKFAELIMSK